VVKARLAKPHRLTRVQIGGHDDEVFFQAAKIVGAPAAVERLFQEFPQRLVAKGPDRQGAAQRKQRIQEIEVAGIADKGPKGLEQEPRDTQAPAAKLLEGGAVEGAEVKGIGGPGIDYRPAEPSGGDAVGENRADHRAGADTDVNIDIAEVDPFQRLLESTNGADLIEGSLGTTSGEGQADLLLGPALGGGDCRHDGGNPRRSCGPWWLSLA
jgi:hypothetical protein